MTDLSEISRVVPARARTPTSPIHMNGTVTEISARNWPRINIP